MATYSKLLWINVNDNDGGMSHGFDPNMRGDVANLYRENGKWKGRFILLKHCWRSIVRIERILERDQRVSNKKTVQGFTLVELLVVIIIIGILAAIALPSFIGRANQSRVTEAISNIRQANQQQSLRVTQGQEFGTTIASLGGGVRPESGGYNYNITVANDAQSAIISAVPKNTFIPPVQGRVTVTTDSTGELQTLDLICPNITDIAALPANTSVCPQ